MHQALLSVPSEPLFLAHLENWVKVLSHLVPKQPSSGNKLLNSHRSRADPGLHRGWHGQHLLWPAPGGTFSQLTRLCSHGPQAPASPARLCGVEGSLCPARLQQPFLAFSSESYPDSFRSTTPPTHPLCYPPPLKFIWGICHPDEVRGSQHIQIRWET